MRSWDSALEWRPVPGTVSKISRNARQNLYLVVEHELPWQRGTPRLRCRLARGDARVAEDGIAAKGSTRPYERVTAKDEQRMAGGRQLMEWKARDDRPNEFKST